MKRLSLDSTRPIFNVRLFGAVGNGSTVDDTAVDAAIAALNAAGGGTLLFPSGYNYVLSPVRQISSNTRVVAVGAKITLNPAYVNTTTVFKGIFRIGSSSGTDLTTNVEFVGGEGIGDAFTSYTTSSPTFNSNDHKYVCLIHSVNTLQNCQLHGFKSTNLGSPITLEKMGGINGTPSHNVHIYDVVEEQVWVGVQFYCNGYLYEDCSVHDIDVKFCYDDAVAIVSGTGGIGGATAIARRISVYNIRGEKSGQTGAFIKLDATGGYQSDINVYDINGYTSGANEYIIGIIGATQANNKKTTAWGFQCSGTWNHGVYAQSVGRQLIFSKFQLEALNGFHFQGNAIPGVAQSIRITDGNILSRNASSADTIEGNGIGFSAGTGSQGFQNIYVDNVSMRNKAIPINEGATVPSGTGTQGTYANTYYSVDVRNSATTDCVFSSTNRKTRFFKEGVLISDDYADTKSSKGYATAMAVALG